MLIQLSSKMVAEHWQEIKEPLSAALIPQMHVSEESFNKILENLVIGTSQAWVLVDEKAEIYAMAVTSFSTEGMTGTKNLLIYGVYAYRLVPKELWQEALETLLRFAKSNDCYRLIAFTQIQRVIEIAEKVNGNVDTRLIYWEV